MFKYGAVAALALSSAAAAQQSGIAAAIGAGQVGERYDGYLGVAATIPQSVRSQVAAVNIQRRSLYSNLASSRQVTPQDVGITAGCSLLARVGVGQSYMLADGVWRRRAAGQPAPVPDYCR